MNLRRGGLPPTYTEGKGRSSVHLERRVRHVRGLPETGLKRPAGQTQNAVNIPLESPRRTGCPPPGPGPETASLSTVTSLSFPRGTNADSRL